MNLSDHIAPPEIEQIRADLERAETQADRRFRRNVRAVAVWGCVAFGTLVVAAVVGVVG